MRFVIAVILVVIYGFVALATSKGFSDVGILISYLLGQVILGPAILAALFCIPKSGRNNKRFFRVFNIVLLLSIFGHAGQIYKITEAAEKPPKTIVGSNEKIEIAVPASWSSLDPPNKNVVLNLKNDSGYLNIIVSYEHAGGDRLELEHYAQMMGNNFKNNIPDFKSISTIEKCESTKLECVYQIVHTTTGDKGTTTILASLSGSDGYYNFMATTNPGLVENYKNDIFNALKSLNENRR
jgi:hypothetical protein